MLNRRNAKQTTNQVVNYGSAVQIIQPGQKSPVTTSRVMLQEKETALSLLERTQTVMVKKSSLGSLVEAINGVKNGNDGKYWTYLINGKEANVGAGQYIVRSDDIIVWQYTKQ